MADTDPNYAAPEAEAEAEAAAATSEAEPTDKELLQTLIGNTDAFFLIVIGIIIFFMQGGFAFLEAGSVRSAAYIITCSVSFPSFLSYHCT